MNIDEFKKRFPDEDSCRYYFESVIWAMVVNAPIANVTNPIC